MAVRRGWRLSVNRIELPSSSARECLLTFALDAQIFAVWLSDVVSLVRAVAITPLAGAPPLVEGVMNVRGEIVPVFGISARFGLPAVPVRPSDQLLLARASDRDGRAARRPRLGDRRRGAGRAHGNSSRYPKRR